RWRTVSRTVSALVEQRPERLIESTANRLRCEMAIETLPLLPHQSFFHILSGHDGRHTLRQESGIRCIPNQAIFAERAADRAAVERDNWDAIVHRFHQGHAETFVLTGAEEQAGVGIDRLEPTCGNRAGEVWCTVQIIAACFCLQLCQEATEPVFELADHIELCIWRETAPVAAERPK